MSINIYNILTKSAFIVVNIEFYHGWWFSNRNQSSSNCCIIKEGAQGASAPPIWLPRNRSIRPHALPRDYSIEPRGLFFSPLINLFQCNITLRLFCLALLLGFLLGFLLIFLIPMTTLFCLVLLVGFPLGFLLSIPSACNIWMSIL